MNDFQQYSMLTPQYGVTEVPLSRFSSGSDTSKRWQTSDIRQDPPQRQRRGLTAMVKGWWLELVSVVLAFCIMVVLWVLLFRYNEKLISETPQRPSLNTLVNIFSTMEAGLIVYVTAEILSQAKWHRFYSESALTDFNIIDSASRGVRGSAQVLVNPRLGFMSLVGALAILLSVLTGPMLQQTVAFQSKWLPDPTVNSSAPIARFFAPPTNPELPKIDTGLKGTILNGLLSSNGNKFVPNFGCPSGNCTYTEPYTSLGICHTCKKLPVDTQCDGRGSCNYTLSNGHVLLNTPSPPSLPFVSDFQFVNVSTAYSETGLMGIQENELFAQFAFTRASIISLTNGPICKTNGTNPDCVLPQRDNATQKELFNGGVIGAICDLAMCTNTYTGDVTEARVTENITAMTDARGNTPRYFAPDDAVIPRDDPVILPDVCNINGNPFTLEQYKDSTNKSWSYMELFQYDSNLNDTLKSNTTKVPIDCVFAMKRVTWASIFQFMTANPFFLDGYGSSDADSGVAGGLFSFYPYLGNASTSLGFANQAFGVEPLFNNGNASFDTIDASFKNLATAMTTYMRQNSAQPKNSGLIRLEAQLAVLPSTAPGILFRSRTVVVVLWYWIILPIVVLVATCGYLTAAIIQGGVKDQNGHRQAHLWKSNALVGLIIGQNSQLFNTTDVLSDHQAMQALKKRRMTLVEDKEGWRFVDREYENVG